MQFVRIDFWPAGLVLASAVAMAFALRVLERSAHSATGRRTRQVLQRALDAGPHNESVASGATPRRDDSGVG
jgi:hypothetical protein